jgi:hypothetical protein
MRLAVAVWAERDGVFDGIVALGEGYFVVDFEVVA